MISRRFFLKALVTAAVYYPIKDVYAYQTPDRILNMYNIHTGERLSAAYSSSGVYDIDLLCDVKDMFGRNKEITIISGYRSSIYNRLLRSLGRNVSKKSMHLKGRAIDFTIEGIDNRKLTRSAKTFKAGGVGRYPEFVHIDIGKIRYW